MFAKALWLLPDKKIIPPLYLNSIPALLIFILCILNLPASGQENREGFLFHLAGEGDYYGVQTELLRLNFMYPEDDTWKLRLAEVSFLLEDTELLSKIRDRFRNQSDKDYVNGLFTLLEVYNRPEDYRDSTDFLSLNGNLQGPDMLNPEKAKNLSYILPGAGLFYTGEKLKGAGSFLVVFSLAYLSHDAYKVENYPAALIFLYFAYQFYKGGAEAAYESAEKYNYRIMKDSAKELILNRKNQIKESFNPGKKPD